VRIGVKKMGVKQALKSLDAFPRAEEHLLQKTQSGAFGNILFLFRSLCAFCSVVIIIVFGIENLFVFFCLCSICCWSTHNGDIVSARAEILSYHIYCPSGEEISNALPL
jgi:hypothetical protein